jgi:drug/metabolite transporter (DMT)-like permease
MVAALLSALGFAVVSITDKVIMTGLGLRVRGFLLFIGFQSVVMAVVILAVDPLPAGVERAVVAKGIAVGLMWGMGAPLILWTVHREEVSRVAPIFQSYPLLVVLFAVVLLGERLSGLELAAALLAIGGALLSGVHFTDEGRIHLSSALLTLGAAMLIIALAQVLLKTVTDDLSFWHAAALRGVGMAVMLIPMNLRPGIARDLGRFMRAPRSVLALAIDAGAAVAALMLITFAISAGPVSLVNAVASASPLFVFFGSVGLAARTSLPLGETLTRRVLTQKAVATSMVVAGLAMLALG